jgi:hypothetical protein
MKRLVLPFLLLPLFVAVPTFAEKEAGEPKQKNEQRQDDEKPVKKVDIKARQMPPAVKRGFKREYPNYKIAAVSRQTYADDSVLYVITYLDKNRAEHDVTFTDDGDEVTTDAAKDE